MKWIPIAKAKPKFKQLYLCTASDTNGIWLGSLAESKVTPEGVQHLFTNGPAAVEVTHIAAVNAPEA
jgi:hypothetical protein